MKLNMSKLEMRGRGKKKRIDKPFDGQEEEVKEEQKVLAAVETGKRREK